MLEFNLIENKKANQNRTHVKLEEKNEGQRENFKTQKNLLEQKSVYWERYKKKTYQNNLE